MSLNNKIIKFAKYGIVLVATITVATAAQSQGIGITTQHVYAEEATSYSEDYRMFYIKDSFYPNLEDYMGLSGRVTTTNEPYTVEEGFTTPEYPYYTIVGSDGKTYSVGDTITVDNPLVNHPNEKDNVLYYYHYPSDPNAATSEAPAPSTSPSTSEAPAPSTSPSTSEAPAVEKPSQKTDDKTTATEKAKADKKADSKPAKTEKSKDANSKKAVATKDNSVANKAAEKSNTTSAPTEQAKDTTAKTNNPDTGNSQSIVKEAAGTVDTAAVNHNDNNGFLALLGFVAAALIGLFQYKKQPKKEK